MGTAIFSSQFERDKNLKKGRECCREDKGMHNNCDEEASFLLLVPVFFEKWSRDSELYGKGKLVSDREEKTNRDNLPGGRRRKPERVSGRKVLQEDLEGLSLAKPKMEKEVARQRASSCDVRAK